MRAAVFLDRGLMVYLNGAGWLEEVSVSSGKRKILEFAKNPPDYSIRVVDLRFDHISKGIGIFLDVEHRQ